MRDEERNLRVETQDRAAHPVQFFFKSWGKVHGNGEAGFRRLP